MKIEIISGSARKQSTSVRVAYALQKWLSESANHTIGVIDCRDFVLPPLQTVFKSVDTTPEAFRPLTKKFFEADAFIWVSPEYNGSYVAAFKNLIDHFPKQLHKPVGIVSVTNGALGGMRAAQQMILLAAAVFAIPSPQLLLVPQVEKRFDAEGNLIDDSFYNPVHNFISEFLWLGSRLAKHPAAATP